MSVVRVIIWAFALVVPPLAVLLAWTLQANGVRLAEPPDWLPWLSILLSLDAGLGATGPWLWRNQIKSFLGQHPILAMLSPEDRLWCLGLALTLYPLVDGMVLTLLGGTLVQMMAFAGVAMVAGGLWTVANRS